MSNKKRPIRVFIQQVKHCRAGLQTGKQFEGVVIEKRTRNKPCEREGDTTQPLPGAHTGEIVWFLNPSIAQLRYIG